jgi:iron complex outermembrane recepter protein
MLAISCLGRMKMNQRITYVRLCALASAVAAAFGHDAAFAQDAQVEEVVVTGSRIVRRDFEANSPIMTVGPELIDNTAAISIEQVLNQLPQFVPAVTQFVTQQIQSNPTNTPGASTISLRGLGSNRNLVLIDGRRGMPVNAAGAVSTNTIPTAAVARVETITGGASSVYGADAMAGVVNFVLKRDYEGVNLDFRYGATQHGGGEEVRLSGLYGANFAGGEGNVLMGFEWSNRERIMDVDRAFYRRGMAEPTVAGTQFVYSDPSYSTASLAGVSRPPNAPTAQGVADAFGVPVAEAQAIGATGTFYFNTDGSLYRTTAPGSSFYNGPLVVDGLTFRKLRVDNDPAPPNLNGAIGENNLLRQVSIPLERHAVFGRALLNITDNMSAFMQANFSEDKTDTLLEYAAATGGRAVEIPYGTGIYAPSVGANGNTLAAFRPGGIHGLNCGPVGGCTNSEVWPVSPQFATLLNSRPLPNEAWNLGTAPTWAEPRSSENNVISYQMVAGFEGSFPNRDWTWEFYGSYGSTSVLTRLYGFGSLERYRFLMTQPNYGRGMYFVGNPLGGGFQAAIGECTTGMPIFESFEVSDDCLRSLAANLQNNSQMEQLVTEFNLQGHFIDLPAGEARFAIGASRRENDYAFQVDSLSSQSSFLDLSMGLYPIGESSGSISMNEVYGELLLPIVSGRRLVQELNFELGYRYSDADPTGSIETYKGLFDWRVSERLRLRGGRQVSNRAPNIAELYLARTQTLSGSSIGDLCSEFNNISALSANPNLNPNAAQVRSMCEVRMGPTGAGEFYAPGNNQPTGAGFVVINALGNTDLTNETGESLTLGAVLQIGNSASMSIDLYEIKISDMVAAQSADSIYTQCFSPDVNPTYDPTTQACQQVIRDPNNGNRAPTDVSYTNLSRLETRGVDVQFNWGRDLGAGALNLSVLASYLDSIKTAVDPSAPFLEFKGTFGPNNISGVQGGSFDYRTFTTVGYSRGDWRMSLRWRHTPEIKPAAVVVDPNTLTLPTAAYNVFDLSGGYDFTNSMSLRFGIENLFDTDPPITNATPFSPGSNTNAGFYDVIGRRGWLAMTFEF